MLAAALVATVAASAPSAHVAVDPTSLGVRVPRSYLGLSVEWDSLEAYARRPAALERLLAPLAASQQGLALRVGGNSADSAWWNPHGRKRPRIVLHNITPRTLQALGTVAGASGGGPVTLGLNLALRDPANALALVRAARERLPNPRRLEAVELGNEPDLYTLARTFRVPGRVHRRLRKHASYSPAAYGRDVATYLRVLRGGLARTPRFAVAGFAKPNWWRFLPGLLDRWQRRTNVVSVHMYALPYCDVRPPPAAWLMSDEATRVLASKVRPIAGLARKRGLSMRITELNSAVCGGRRGISDRSYAAVWLADILFALLNRGARQADVHTWDRAVYAPFSVAGGGVRARPALSGMLAFARAAPAGSRLAASRATGPVRAWATRDPAGDVRVAVIAPRAASVAISVPRRRCAAVWVATPRGRGARPCSRRLVLPARSVAVARFA